MTFQIEPFGAAHADGVRNLIVPIQRDEFGLDITYADQPDLHDIPGFYRQGCGEFWVARTDDESVVGSVALIDIGAHQAAAFRAAHRFYEKAGFGLIDESDLPPAFPRMAVDTRFYRQVLD